MEDEVRAPRGPHKLVEASRIPVDSAVGFEITCFARRGTPTRAPTVYTPSTEEKERLSGGATR